MPAGTVGLDAVVAVPTVRPTAVRLVVAADCVCPTTFGTLRIPRLTPTKPNGPVNYDPAASTENAEARQAVADEIFKRDKTG